MRLTDIWYKLIGTNEGVPVEAGKELTFRTKNDYLIFSQMRNDLLHDRFSCKKYGISYDNPDMAKVDKLVYVQGGFGSINCC